MTPPAALVLAAGLGTRLRPLTWIRAKPAVPVGRDPLVVRILRWLADAGVRNVILNLHHRPESITRVVGDGTACGVHVRYSWEHPILGSAGGPRRAFSLVPDDELLVVNGDTVTDVDLGRLIGAHRASAAYVTMALTVNPQPARYGAVRLTNDGAYAGTSPVGGPPAGWHFVGAQVVRREALCGVVDGVPAQSLGQVYDALAASAPGCVRGWITQASFFDIGTPETYLAACLALGGDVSIGQRCHIATSAKLSRSILWDDVSIAEGVQLTDCVVADRVVVPRGSRYHRSILLRLDDMPAGATGRVDGDVLVAPLEGG